MILEKVMIDYHIVIRANVMNVTETTRPFDKEQTGKTYSTSTTTTLLNRQVSLKDHLRNQQLYQEVSQTFVPEKMSPSGNDVVATSAAAAAAAVGPVVGIDYPPGATSVVGVWTLGLGLLGDSECSEKMLFSLFFLKKKDTHRILLLIRKASSNSWLQPPYYILYVLFPSQIIVISTWQTDSLLYH